MSSSAEQAPGQESDSGGRAGALNPPLGEPNSTEPDHDGDITTADTGVTGCNPLAMIYTYKLLMSSSAEQVPGQESHSGGQADAPNPSPGESRTAGPDRELTIAVMGVTGSGKSSLIREITRNLGVEVSHGLSSCTAKVTSYPFQHHGSTITLVDTPGFNDTSRSDLEVLTEISTWARETYKKGRRLSGIIYLHRISNIRMDGGDLRSLGLFKSLVGNDFMRNVLLTTTQWSGVAREEGEKREKELRDGENFWKGLLDLGAITMRYDGNEESGSALLRKIADYDPGVLEIQRELVDLEKSLVDTSAGQAIQEELRRMQKKHEKDMRALEEECREAVAARDEEMMGILELERTRLAAQMEKLAADERKLVETLPPARALVDKSELHLLPSREALLIYAKGTLERGNVGTSGSLLFSILDAQLRSRLAIQGVYSNPVTRAFYMMGVSFTETKSVLGLVRKGIMCSPTKKIFLCGYGQGTMILEQALFELNDQECARISGVVFLGYQENAWAPVVPPSVSDRSFGMPSPFYRVLSPSAAYRYREDFSRAAKFIERKMREG